jgi:hypothetical protein
MVTSITWNFATTSLEETTASASSLKSWVDDVTGSAPAAAVPRTSSQVPNQSLDVADSPGVGPVYSKIQNPVPTRSETYASPFSSRSTSLTWTAAV